MSTEFFICGGCGRRVDPGETDTVAARRQIRDDSLAGDDGYLDGEGVYFHLRCYPGDRLGVWRRQV